MKQKKNKNIIAWVMLIILIGMALILTYLKFFNVENINIEEKSVNNSSSNAIHQALKDITINFNQNSKIKEYAENNINIKASVNNYSIYISYITDTTTTYEFTYENLCLNIVVDDNEKDQTKFNSVYEILIESVQKRINNTENIDEIINNFLTTATSYDGLSKEKLTNGTSYQMNITKKLKTN